MKQNNSSLTFICGPKLFKRLRCCYCRTFAFFPTAKLGILCRIRGCQSDDIRPSLLKNRLNFSNLIKQLLEIGRVDRTKGSLISEGILTLVTLPKKGVKSLP